MTNQAAPSAGNARALNQISECEDLFLTYTPPTASEIIATACRRGGFTSVNPEDVVPALGFIRAMRSPSVDVRAVREEIEGKASAACNELLGAIADNQLDDFVIYMDAETD